jgi:hypothetical protein
VAQLSVAIFFFEKLQLQYFVRKKRATMISMYSKSTTLSFFDFI